MADAHDGGSPGSGMPAYMYEDLKKMVYADDPEAVRHVGDWLGSRGRLISDFAVTVHRELSKVDDLYSSAEGAPALKAQLYRAFDELQKLGGDLIQNGHVLNAAAQAIETAQGQVDAVYPDTKPGDAVFRGTNAYTDPPSQKAQPYVESLNTYMYNLSDALVLVDPNKDIGQPGNPPGDGSNPPTQPGASSLPGSGAVAPGRIGAGKIEAGPGTILPPGPTLGGQPATGGEPRKSPGRGMFPPAVGGSPDRGRDSAGSGLPGYGSGRRIRMPGARNGDLLGRMRPPAAAGGPPGRKVQPNDLPTQKLLSWVALAHLSGRRLCRPVESRARGLAFHQACMEGMVVRTAVAGRSLVMSGESPTPLWMGASATKWVASCVPRAARCPQILARR